MKLADDITVGVAGKVITLRPSLRHAIRLERRDGSFAGIRRELAEESLSAACEIIHPHYPHKDLKALVSVADLSYLKFPLINYVTMLFGIEEEDIPAEGEAKGATIPVAEHLTGLYRIGTGWLGWTPAETLDATPAEIREAHKGRMDMLKALFGSGEEKSKLSKTPLTAEQRAVQLEFNMRRRARAAAKKKGA